MGGFSGQAQGRGGCHYIAAGVRGMKYRYAYSLLEAACALCDVDHQTVAAAMSASDMERARTAMKDATAVCRQCPEEFDCPTWVGLCADEPRLVCPRGYDRPPSYDEKDYIQTRRYIPDPAEAPPEVIEICQLLHDALAEGALSGTTDAIPRASLIDYWAHHYPGDKPAFLFDEPEVAGDGGKAEIVLGALLEYLKTQRQFKLEAAKLEITDFSLGRGFGSRSLDTVFAKAQEAFRNARNDTKK